MSTFITTITRSLDILLIDLTHSVWALLLGYFDGTKCKFRPFILPSELMNHDLFDELSELPFWIARGWSME